MAITLKDLPEYGAKVGYKPQVFISDGLSPVGGINYIVGIPVVINNDLPTSKKWVFPYDRFIEYGPEDEWWAIPWGFGHWKTLPTAYEVNGEIICNQEFVKELEKYAKH